MSFLGSDTDELREAGQKCQEGAETTDEVIMYLRALIIALRAASFFTGGASAAYAQYLETTVVPWLQKVSAALKMFAQVLLSQAKAQDDVSAGETVDFGTLPTYVSPLMPQTNTCDYPPLVSPESGVGPAATVDPGTTGTGVSTTTNPSTGGVAPISTSTTPGLGTITPGDTTGAPPTAHGPANPAFGTPYGPGNGDLNGTGAGVRDVGVPATSTGTGTSSTGTGTGTTGATGSPVTGTGATPGAIPSGTDAGSDCSSSGTPSSRTFGSTSGVDGEPASTATPLTTTQSGIGGGSFGTAAGIATGAAALGLGGAAAANRRNGRADSDIEGLVAANGRGSRGDDVRALQEKLTDAGYDTQGADGQWGGRTQAAYEAWRTDHPMEIRTGSGYTSPDGFDYTKVAGVTGNPHVTPEFLREMEGVAQRVGARPEDLMAVMALESNRTFAPDVRNADTGATGLIQFMPKTAEGLHTSTAALSGMSAREQLPYVEQYLESRRGHIGNLESLYTSILYGSPKADPATTLWSQGTEAYGDNHGLDRNRDGRITAGEAADSVRTFIRN